MQQSSQIQKISLVQAKMGPKMGPKYYIFGMAQAKRAFVQMSWMMAHFWAKMHQKMVQLHILDSFFENMSFWTLKLVSLDPKILKKHTKTLWTQMGPNLSCTVPT